MNLARFLLKDNLGKIQFFKETFLLTDTSMEVILEMLFLSFSNTDITFAKKPNKLTILLQGL